MKTNWYATFFHGLALEFWRNAVSFEQTLDEVNFIASELQLPVGSHILDVACGNGRHSMELAKRGYRMTAIDLSDEYIEEARRCAREAGANVELIRIDMHDIAFDRKFDSAFCFGNSFGYADHAETMKFLTLLSRSLRSGAKLVLETGLVAESLLPALQHRRWHHVKDVYALSENGYDAANSLLHTDYTFIRDGVIETGTATYSVYTIAELKRLLLKCGLVVKSLYGATDRRPFALGNRLFLAAERT